MLRCIRDNYPIGYYQENLIKKGDTIQDYKDSSTFQEPGRISFDESIWSIGINGFRCLYFKSNFIDISEYREQRINQLGC
jgi:hypothetical protein